MIQIGSMAFNVHPCRRLTPGILLRRAGHDTKFQTFSYSPETSMRRRIFPTGDLGTLRTNT
jgi:hypothetical protein